MAKFGLSRLNDEVISIVGRIRDSCVQAIIETEGEKKILSYIIQDDYLFGAILSGR
jgi:hypothetical protein